MKVKKKKKKRKVVAAKYRLNHRPDDDPTVIDFKFDPAYMNWEGPFEEETAISKWHVWWTEDRRYRVVRAIGKFDPDMRAFHAFYGKLRKLGEYKTLVRAMERCKDDHIQHTLQPEIFTNLTRMVKRAKKNDLHKIEPMRYNPELINFDRQSAATKAKPVEVGSNVSTNLGGSRSFIFGFPTTAVIRWMGKNGWSFKNAKTALINMKVPVADATIRAQLRAGQKGERGDPADLSDDQRKELEKSVR